MLGPCTLPSSISLEAALLVALHQGFVPRFLLRAANHNSNARRRQLLQKRERGPTACPCAKKALVPSKPSCKGLSSHKEQAQHLKIYMTLFNHLKEVRERAFYLILSLTVTFTVFLLKSKESLFLFVFPFLQSKREFVFIELTEGVLSTIKVCFLFSILSIVPLVLYNLYTFLSPTFRKSEDYKARGWLLAAFLLFVSAGVSTNLLVLPFLSKFLLLFEVEMSGFTMELQPRMVSYVDWLQSVFLFTQLAFQLPLLFSFLFSYSILKSSTLCKNRRSTFFVLLLLAAFLSPPDPVIEFLTFVSLFLFAEMIIWIGFLFEKRFQ